MARFAVRLMVLTVSLGAITIALYGIWVGILSVLWHTVGGA